MLPAQLQSALATLSEKLTARPELRSALGERWQSARPKDSPELPEDMRAAADAVTGLLPDLSASEAMIASLFTPLEPEDRFKLGALLRTIDRTLEEPGEGA